METFDSEEWARIEQIGARLQSQFGVLLRTVPPSAITVRGLSAHLDVDRNTCHRLLSACASSNLPADVVERAPGVAALRQVLDAFRGRGADPRSTRAVEQTLAQYERLVSELGSRNRLLARLGATREAGERTPTDPTETARTEARRQRYESDRVILGTSHEAQLRIAAFRIDPTDPDRIEAGLAVGGVGTVAERSAVPLLLYVARGPREESAATTLDGAPILELESAILEGFSSQPVPPITAIEEAGRVIEVIEPSALAEVSGFDLFTGFRFSPFTPHPRLLETPLLTQLARIRVPSRAFVHEVYLDRELARQSVPSYATFLPSDEPFITFSQQWHNRLPGRTSLELFPAADVPGTVWYPRHRDLVSHLFERLGWPADRFTGHRYSELFPLTGVTYAMAFDFGEGVDIQSSDRRDPRRRS